MSSETVDILLATYNGAKFIKSQLYSLQAQSYQDWRLIVHDDGSTDDTLSIVRSFAAKDDRIILIEDGLTFGNAGGNFLHLLQFSSANYIMFCDQDDIWFESKIECHLNVIKEKKTPFAVYSNGYTYNGEVITSQNFITFHRSNLKDSLFLNGGIHGCCIMFNRYLLDLAQNNLPAFIFMHDHFITMLAVTFGKMHYIDKALMLYRQHNENVTGNMQLGFTERLKTFLDPGNPVLEQRHYNANQSFYECFKNQLSDEQRRLFEAYLRFPEVSKLERLRIIEQNGFVSKNKTQLLFKTLIRKAI